MAWLYILSNPAMAGVVKIGYTYAYGSTPATRAAELSRDTGVPAPFTVEYAVQVAAYPGHNLMREIRNMESTVHAALYAHRVNNRREFFRVSVEAAMNEVDRVTAPTGRVQSTLDPHQRTAAARQLKAALEQRMRQEEARRQEEMKREKAQSDKEWRGWSMCVWALAAGALVLNGPDNIGLAVMFGGLAWLIWPKG